MHDNSTKKHNVPPMLDCEQAARIASCPSRSIRKLLADGKLPGAKLGSTWRVPTLKFLEQMNLAVEDVMWDAIAH